MKNKFTFKKHIRTGKYRSFEKELTDIKLNTKITGSISEETGVYRIGLIVRDLSGKNPNCCWKWIFLATKFDSEKDARVFLNKNIDRIMEKYELHPLGS